MNILHTIEAHPIISICTAIGVGSGVILEMLGPLFNQLFSFVLRIFFIQKYVKDNFSIHVIYNYLNAKGRPVGINKEMYDATRYYIHPIEEEGVVWSRMKSFSSRLWFLRGRPIMYWPSDDNNDYSSFMFFRWTFNWTKLLKDAAELDDDQYSNVKKSKRKFCIKHHHGEYSSNTKVAPAEESSPTDTSSNDDAEYLFWNKEDIGVGPKPDDPMEYLSINEPMAKVIRRVKFWFNNKDWFKDRQLIWKLGVLLYGKPGTGKTSILRAIAEDLDLPLHTFDLASMDNQDFMVAWKDSQKNKPRMVVFEDFDTVFHGRINQIKDSTLDFATILNCIDGIEREHGLLLAITTNEVQHIDVAMGRPSDEDKDESTRAGRIDIVSEMIDMDLAGRLKIALRILKGEHELAQVMAERYKDDNVVKFQDRCVKKALEIFWGIDKDEV